MFTSSPKWPALAAFLAVQILVLISPGAFASSGCIVAEFDKTFGGLGDDDGRFVQQTSDGDYIIVGSTESSGAGGSDVWLIKADRDGNQMWNKTFGGQKDDSGEAVLETLDGGYIIVGATRSKGAGSYDIWAIKTDKEGNLVWDETFGGQLDDEGHAVFQTADGGYIITGRSRASDSGGRYDAFLLKIDEYGNRKWLKSFGGPQDDEGDSVLQTADGGYIIAGITNSFGAGGYDAWLIKTDQSGNKIWDRTFGGQNSEFNPWSKGWFVEQVIDGGYILSGSTISYGSGGYDAWLIRTDMQGNEIWNGTFGGALDEEGAAVMQTVDGNYILLVSTGSYGAGGYDAWLINIDQDGREIWKKTLGGKTDDKGYFVQQASDGGYIVVGKTFSSSQYLAKGECCLGNDISSRNQAWLVKIRSESPVIIAQPQSLAVCEGQAAAFAVSATGKEPLSYQWKKNGVEIYTATENTYSVQSAGLDDAGLYSVTVSNSCGLIESIPSRLDVNTKPSIQVQPLSQTVCEDSPVVMSVDASGTKPFAYQWKKNGEAIPGATANIYEISRASTDDAGNYSAVVSNICGSVESNFAILTVNSMPWIQVQPASQTICSGSNAAFGVEAAGSEPISYQWKKNGAVIEAASSRTFSIINAKASDAGTYSVMVSNSCGYVESEMAVLTVNSAPTIQVQPFSQETCAGSSITFSIEATGTKPLLYQWMKNGENISGADQNTFSISSTTAEDTGTYSVMVSNSCGYVESEMAALTVNSAPTIQVQPSSQETCAGSSANFSIETTGTKPLSYQWMKNGENISGANSNVFSISNTIPEDSGSYGVIVSNNCGSVESSMASLTVNSAPTIHVQPLSQDTCAGSSVTFSIEATGTQPLLYQWVKNGENISGANGSVFIISNSTPEDAGTYSVMVSNSCGSVESSMAALIVNSVPTIHVQPLSQETCGGSSVTFGIEATGTQPLLYQWMKNGENIAEANGNVLSISNTIPEDSGSYSVTVSNVCGSVKSSMATLTVNSAPTIYVQPLSQETCSGSSVTFSIEATGTQPLLYQWLKNGENISGAIENVFGMLNTMPEDSGNYSVKVSNGCGSVESSMAALTVNSPPSIQVQPLSQDTCTGSSVIFSIEA
ncbi:MAG: immunoglobulin domain-containing protein, partial [Methanothrix sp.]|nr:immunoglobulin domain-containing protein [Methanothrix sp.]